MAIVVNRRYRSDLCPLSSSLAYGPRLKKREAREATPLIANQAAQSQAPCDPRAWLRDGCQYEIIASTAGVTDDPLITINCSTLAGAFANVPLIASVSTSWATANSALAKRSRAPITRGCKAIERQ
jgi:hypothetical protein